MRRVAVIASAVLAAAASAAPASGPPTRPWGGTTIEPLDLPLPSGSQPSPSRRAPRRPADAVLSNERTLSRWAYVARVEPIRARPDRRARRVATLHQSTEDGFPEVYLLLRSHVDGGGREWIELRVPMRPNGRVGWVPRSALGAFHRTEELIVVDRRRLRMLLYVRGRRRWSAPVGVGKPGTPTPPGHFWIRERFKIADPRSGYWPYAFGTADYSTLTDWPGGGVVGIHGPYYEPQRIPGAISHGCIRLRTGDDAWLARHVSVGVPLRVR